MNKENFAKELMTESPCKLTLQEASAIYLFSQSISMGAGWIADEMIGNGYDYIISSVSRRNATTFSEVYAVIDEIWLDNISTMAFPTFESFIEELGKTKIQQWVDDIVVSIRNSKQVA